MMALERGPIISSRATFGSLYLSDLKVGFLLVGKSASEILHPRLVTGFFIHTTLTGVQDF